MPARDLRRAVAPASAEPAVDFSPEWYLRTYPDVAAAGIDPLQHYLSHGRREGRLPRENRACLLEAKLWGGFSQWACEALERLLVDDGARPDERAHAAWVLAGWLAFQDGNWCRAASLAAQSHAANCPSPAGPVLLEGDALRREGCLLDARRVLRLALTQRPNTPDLYLAYANTWFDELAGRHLEWINRALLLGGWQQSGCETLGRRCRSITLRLRVFPQSRLGPSRR